MAMRVKLEDKVWPWVAGMPSTNVRIIVTLGAVIATTWKVITTEWDPPLHWLGFLTANLGLDVAQFFAKRKTQNPPPAQEG